MATISPRVDIAFKKIFGVEENKDLLISLINSIVSEEDQISDVTLLNPYNPKNFRNDKLSILDIKAKGVNGKLYNIEIQITDEADYDKRALYYWAKLYTEQLKNSDEYSSLVHTSLDTWVAFLTRHDLLNKNHLPSKLDNPSLKKALDVLEVMNFLDEEREAYESHLKWLRIEANTLKKCREESLAEGRVEGRAEGRAEGIEIGESKKAIEIAQELYKQGMLSIEQIRAITKLSDKDFFV
jgi:hypothetical protein